MKRVILLFFGLIFFLGCHEAVNTSNPTDSNQNEWINDTQGPPQERKWTFIVYMAADNDLESAAIANFNELEAVRYGNAPISILVLLDRSPYYDRTNGDWSDTRLFEIKSDPGGLTGTMVSSRLDCPELGLTRDTETELNTSDPLVLSRLIDFAKRAYPAENYALFIWGHGTGWRSRPTQNEQTRAIAFDDTHEQFMSLPAFGRAVSGKGLSVIGFDTCYAAVLEVVYEIKNDARLFIGSQGAILSSGWDYYTLFSDFIKKPNLTISDLGNSVQYQFMRRYGSLNNASISQIELSRVETLFIKFENFTGLLSETITDFNSRNMILGEILQNVESHYFTSFPSDMFIDISDFSKKMIKLLPDFQEDMELQNKIIMAADELNDALAYAVPSSWARNGTEMKIGVHFIPMHGVAVPAAMHELAYVRGSIAMDKSSFVENSRHWVPNAIPQERSFLDKVFYTVYN